MCAGLLLKAKQLHHTSLHGDEHGALVLGLLKQLDKFVEKLTIAEMHHGYVVVGVLPARELLLMPTHCSQGNFI